MYHVIPKASARAAVGDYASDAVNFPYGLYSAQTLVIQNQLNQKLIQNGFCPLIADGKLGAATCGAAVTIGGLGPGDIVMAPGTCTDFKQPNNASAGCGTGPAVPTSAAKPTTATVATPAASSGSVWLGAVLLVGSAAAVAGLLYWARTRR